jgi:hypothetical protein
MEDHGVIGAAAGGGLTLEERRRRAAEPACACAKVAHAGVGSGPASHGSSPAHDTYLCIQPNGPRAQAMDEEGRRISQHITAARRGRRDEPWIF